ncbi:ABC transporter permease [Dactylosporangium vinaceum]|uniref:ABC transporter permease n=1 Tax=Dactylosporangium vinaceum TaxID=53362 RepID=A0ABV5M9Z9_9ACTN|nr:ABC transporter permease [Dactylosporangium vinaceum]UAB93159.1 ABC transporter permease [Dactylosporangium vinaceum]
MRRLALRMLRNRPGTAIATLLALTAGAVILTAMGVLVESGLGYSPPPGRYAAADIVVARPEITITTRDLDGSPLHNTVGLPEGGTVPVSLAGPLRGVPGVASVVVDDAVPVAVGGRPAEGHGWSSAGLMRYTLERGTEPKADDEIVVAAGLGLRPGSTVDVVVGGQPLQLKVSGVGSADAVFFTDARMAALSAHPGRALAIALQVAPGADRDAVAAAVARTAGADARVYSGADRGSALRSADRAARELLIAAGGGFGGYVVLLVVFVVAGTVGLSVRHRRRELALLRAIAATPRQARRLIMTEAGFVSLIAVVLGVPGGLGAAQWLHGELVGRGFLPAGFPMRPGALAAAAVALLTVLSAVLAALIAARRITRVKPAEALGEAAVEPARGGRVRLIFGVVFLAGAVSSSSFTLAASGQTALAGALGMLYLFVAAVALLAPWINAFAARVLTPPLRALFGASGRLAAANLHANARGGAAVLTALVLAVGFGGSVWFVQDNIERGTLAQGRAGLRAERAVVAPAGLPPALADEIRHVPGVRAATGVSHTSVIVTFMGDPEVAAAQVVDPAGLAATMDLKVTEGSLDALAADAVAVSSLRASTQGWHAGSTAEVHLGDGTPVRLKVAAVYDSGLGFGDFTLARATVAGHTAAAADEAVLVQADASATAALDEIAARYPGGRVTGTAELTAQVGADLAVSAWLNRLLIGVMVGYAALAAANVMVMAALSRRRELALLRLVGVTRRQAARMVRAEQLGLLGTALLLGVAIAAVTLTAVVRGLTGALVPYVPPLGGVMVLGGTTLLALTTTILPIGRLLRAPVMEHIGLRD